LSFVLIGFFAASVVIFVTFYVNKALRQMLDVYLFGTFDNKKISIDLGSSFAFLQETFSNLNIGSYRSPLFYLLFLFMAWSSLTFLLSKSVSPEWKFIFALVIIGSAVIISFYQGGASVFTWISLFAVIFIMGFKSWGPIFDLGQILTIRNILSTGLLIAITFIFISSSYPNVTVPGYAIPRGSEYISQTGHTLRGNKILEGNLSVSNYFCNLSTQFVKTEAALLTKGDALIRTTNFFQQCEVRPDRFFSLRQNGYYYGYINNETADQINKSIFNAVVETNPQQILFIYSRYTQTKDLTRLEKLGYKIIEVYRETGTRYLNKAVLLTKM
jgi:hypothetical protein